MGLRIEVIKKETKAHINKKREAHSSLASLSKAPENCPLLSKRATPNFTPICIYQSLHTHYAYCVDTP